MSDGRSDILSIDHTVGTGIGNSSADVVTTDAHEEGEEHWYESSDERGGTRSGEKRTSTEDRAGDQESARSGVPEAASFDDVLDVAGEDLEAILPHISGAGSKTSDQSSRDHRQEHVHVEHGVDRVVGCDGAKREESEDPGDDASRRIADVDTVVAVGVLTDNILVIGGVHCLTFPVCWPRWPLLMARRPMGTVHPGPPGTSAGRVIKLY